MNQFKLECLTNVDEFAALEHEWERFIGTYFEHDYSHTQAWLSAWWKTYYQGSQAFVFIQRHPADNRIVAAAPLMILKERFGGLPVRSLLTLGTGLGNDGFLISPEARDFTKSVMSRLKNDEQWNLAKFSRVKSSLFSEEMRLFGKQAGLAVDFDKTVDYYLDLPDTYDAYLGTRSRNFRSKLNQKQKWMASTGAIDFAILDPFAQPELVINAGTQIAEGSWQYREGKSHFSAKGTGFFYKKLFGEGRGCGGEEFNLLTLGGRPVAYLFGCRRGRTYFLVDTAYHEDFNQFSVGRVLFCRVIERLIREGLVDSFDLEGGGDYKEHYSTAQRSVDYIILYNRSPYSNLVRFLRKSQLIAIFGQFLKRHSN